MFDVITIGTATRDVFLRSPSFKVLKDPRHLKRLGFTTGEAECLTLGGKIEVETPVFTIGGGAANAAVTFARQGLKTAILAKISKDANGKAILEDLKSERIAPLMRFDANKATAYSVVLLSAEGERTILNYRGASEDLTSGEIPKSFSAKAAYIVPGRIPLHVMERIIIALKRDGAFIAMNPSKYYLNLGIRKLKPILSTLDVILLNREEGAYLTGFRYEEEKKIFKKFDSFVKGIAAMTDGPKGVLVSDGKKIYRAGTYKEKIVASRTGAGDAFGSGFVAGLLQNSKLKIKNGNFTEQDIKHAIRVGSANATSVVEHVGTQMGILKKNELKEVRWRTLPISVKKFNG